MRMSGLFLTGVLLVHAAADARAARTQVLSAADFDKLADGEPVTTSVVSTGAVVLAPAIQKLAAVDGGPVLALVCDPRGTCYAATGNPARVVAVDAAGKARTLLEPAEALVTALALDGKGGLFAATSPSGKVVRIELGSGKADTWWTPEAKQVWGLAWDGTALWAVTGDPGALYRVTEKDKAVRVGESALKEKLLRAVAALPGGKGVVVGGGRKGIIWQVDGKGVVFAHHDSALEEVTSLAVRADGTLAAGLVANEGKGEGNDALLAASDAGDDDDSTAADTKNSEVVIIYPSGDVRRVWRGKKDAAYAVAFDDAAGVYIGTGGRGRLYRADVDGRSVTLVGRVESARITAMARGPRGVVLGLSHASALAQLGSAAVKEGVYLGPVWDAERHARFGRLWARGDVPAGTRLSLQVRVGNTDEPDDTWSTWSAALPFPGGNPALARARFAQVKATLVGDGKGSPVLRELHLAWRGQNVPPTVTAIDVLAPGVRVEPMPSDDQKGRTFSVSARAFEDFELKPLQSPAPAEPAARAKQTYEAGWRTLTWHAADEDDDELRYGVDLLTEGGDKVLSLGSGLKDPFLSVEESRLRDGAYRVRVTAEDWPSNPPPEAARTELLSAVFTVDRTAPVLKVSVAGPAALRVEVEDLSPLVGVACGVDGGEPVPGLAADAVLDSPREVVTVTLPRPTRGKHFVSCRAEDAMGNVGRAVLDWDVP
ncbi:MAG: hypothetical protein HY904_00670 [Deltaproteobacteria bacterium]|nr:hypothetical protein [Deltaproteobacteria bacterium]